MLSAFVVTLAIASAQPTEGTYKIVRDDVRVLKEMWSMYCDQKAGDTPSTNGARLKVTHAEGGEWLASGGGRKFGTGWCEAQNRGLAAVARKKSGGRIYMKCKSKRVTLGTEESEQQVWATPTAVYFKTSATRIFRHRGDDCISRLERLTKAVYVPPAGEPPPPKEEPQEVASTSAEEQAPVDPCETPGKAAKLELTPKVAVAKVGEAPACYQVTAVDENGCSVAPGKASFTVDLKGVGAIDDRGCFEPTATKEQLVAIIAKASGLEAAASARIVPKGEEKSKKSLQTLAKASKSKRVKAVIGEVTRGKIIIRPLESEPPELPPLEEAPFPWLAVAGTGSIALLASIIGFLLVLRRRRDQEVPTDLQAAPVVTPKKGGGLVCPQCEFEFAVGEATHCPFDGKELEPLGRDARQTMFVPAAGGMVCPTCKTKYPTKARFCGHDRTPLLPDFGQFDGEGGDA